MFIMMYPEHPTQACPSSKGPEIVCVSVAYQSRGMSIRKREPNYFLRLISLWPHVKRELIVNEWQETGPKLYTLCVFISFID